MNSVRPPEFSAAIFHRNFPQQFSAAIFLQQISAAIFLQQISAAIFRLNFRHAPKFS
jgi:hypothetical protein